MSYRIVILFFLSVLGSLRADVYLQVTGGQLKRAKIAVGKIHPAAGYTPNPQLDADLSQQLLSDLELVALFENVDPEKFATLDTPGNINNLTFSDWSAVGAAFVLRSSYKVEGNELILEAAFFDVLGTKKIFGMRYTYDVKQYPRLIHALAEDILRELTGERGLFRSRVVMICRDHSGSVKPKKGQILPKEVYIADPDGRNLVQLTTDKTISVSPSWAPNGKVVVYTQYQPRKAGSQVKVFPVLKSHNLLTGTRTILSEKDGMNSGAAWSPKGDMIAITLSFNGRPELYLVSPSGTGEPIPLSRTIQWRSISGTGFQPNYASLLFDVEPSWSADGNQLVFSSARTGNPMIYVLDVATRIARQLTFAGTYNSSPDWSPKGEPILFAAQLKQTGHFDIYQIDTNGNNLKPLTEGGREGSRRINSEDPSFAPTGRHFAFSNNERGYYGIYVMSLDRSVRRLISPADKECTNPSWGPFEG